MSNFTPVAVIDPAVRTAEVECYNRMVELSPLPLTYHLPALFGLGSLPGPETRLAGIVILGSSSSVHDKLPWQSALAEWVKPRLEAGVPFLGLCFGHQYLAHLLGGEIGYVSADKEKRRGFRKVKIKGSRLWGDCEGELVVSHRETVTHAPKDFKVLATGEAGIEAIEHERLPLFGLQPHPEAVPAFLKNVGNPPEKNPARFQFGHSLVEKFLRHCELTKNSTS